MDYFNFKDQLWFSLNSRPGYLKNEWISRKWQLFVSTWLILNAKVGWITIRGAVYCKGHNNVDLPSTLLLTKKLVMSRSCPDIFSWLVDCATISKNRWRVATDSNYEVTNLTSRAMTAIPNHAECAMRCDLDLEIEVKSTSKPIKINFNFVWNDRYLITSI